jgi:hypothetical protein
MKLTRLVAAFTVAVVASASVASSQSAPTVPFYYAGGTPVDPQVSYLAVGVADNVQARVSQDRKYVTLDVNAALTGNSGLSNFTFQKPGLGFVGSPTAVAGVAKANAAQGSARGAAVANPAVKNPPAGAPGSARAVSATPGRAGSSNTASGTTPVPVPTGAATILETPLR